MYMHACMLYGQLHIRLAIQYENQVYIPKIIMMCWYKGGSIIKVIATLYVCFAELFGQYRYLCTLKNTNNVAVGSTFSQRKCYGNGR